ncbi:YgfZ/GcvT domain-containing protein [sulfur-oxidizing endosymbiont of Gigantopelta aegis]|uniref:CAF17-like 4Fe-4S cluster assembly/insertion protein YgfZ n=1 Tax=sulfur-oxidizing endosymbiont of Gigantopelta aegis TaxID=2794934 RepID=UPI0018DEB84C|nr:folate-binding protein YgfZ [sulfur-oxidizing endosymbiont of Gigantopelta aegis]
MSNNWYNFLSPLGAIFNDDKEVSFNASEQSTISSLQGDLYLTDLSYLGLIEVSGDDKKTYLQGQLTNDINAISSTLSHLSGLCTPKGRLRALFTIFAQGNKLYLQLPYPLLEETLKRLKMFVMMSKVELTNVSDSLIKIGVFGQQAINQLKASNLSIPGEPNMVTETDGIQLIRLAGETPRFECIGCVEKITALWQALQPKAQLINTSHWRIMDIEAGIPNVFASSKEAFIPQMLNLQILNGINFKKGCYTGQEVVARMQYLGKLKRKMYRAHCDAEQNVLPGDLLYSEKSKSGQGAGHIVDAQLSPKGGLDLLAVITSDAVDNNDIFLDEAMQLPLTIVDLPYSLEIEES